MVVSRLGANDLRESPAMVGELLDQDESDKCDKRSVEISNHTGKVQIELMF
jgi:hypothetical protein